MSTCRTRRETMKKDELTKDDIDKIFDYNPLSGVLTRKRTGSEVKDLDYITIPVAYFTHKKEKYGIATHIICWMMYYGQWPDKVVFHRDFNKRNNKITNLMLISTQDNYKILGAYNNLTKYCDVKIHHKYQDIYLVRYLAGGRLKHEKYEDYGFAKAAADQMKNKYRRVIIKMGGIPPN